MTAIFQLVIQLFTAVFGFLTTKEKAKQDQIKRDEDVKQSAEYKDAVRKNDEVKVRDEMESLVKDMDDPLKRERVLAELRRRVAK